MSCGTRGLRRRALVLALALGVPAICLTSVLAAGQNAESDKSPPRAAKGSSEAVPHDSDNITAISLFMEAIAKGNEKALAKDLPAAIDLYKRAMMLNPRSPLGPYLLGETYLLANNLDEAEAALKQADELGDQQTPLVRSHVLLALAGVYERQRKWAPAHLALQAYTAHAVKLGADGGAFPQSGATRLKAVDDWLKLEKDMALVRERIAAEKAAANAAAAAKSAKPPAKK